jgi:para-aminobenzoate synthetase component 1
MRAATVRAAIAALPADCVVAVVRDSERWIVGAVPEAIVDAHGADAFTILDRVRDGWWAGWLTYELGHAVERVAGRAPADAVPLPDLRLARFDARLVVEPERIYVDGDGEARGLLLDAARAAVASDAVTDPPSLSLREWSSTLSAVEFGDRVRTIVALIEAGDCYQVNLTRRLTCNEPADPAALFAALTAHNPAPHAALLRFPDAAVVSASPERFLRREGDAVETRPIKGTSNDTEAGMAALATSEKDRAENVMIVDLARNDLGRVSAFGTVTVPELCAVEQHPGLAHLVSTVRSTLRPGSGLGALVRATFPPASITGAPKPRVMQVIDDLEPTRRGVYCGAVGWIDGDRQVADFNVAIRTFIVAGGQTHLGVGAGIVADSDPYREWEETELKASRLLAAAGRATTSIDRRVGVTP